MYLPKVNGLLFQTIATFLGNLITIGYGIMYGITSPNIALFQSEDSPLMKTPMTNEEVSWITSYLCIGGFVGSLVFGQLADRCGRKLALIVAGLPQMLGWFAVTFGYNSFHIYLSRFLCGLAGGGAFVVLPLYVSEISEDNSRGSLGSYISTFRNLGIVFGFILGSFVEYEIMALIGLSISIIFVMVFPFVQESPYYYLMKNDMALLEKSLRWFRGIRTLDQRSNKEFSEEVEKFKKLQIENNLKENQSLTWRDFFNRPTIKAFFIGLVLITTMHSCGLFALLNYSSTIFKEAGSNLSPNVSSIILAIIQTCGSYMANLITDKIGRKIIIAFTSLMAGLGLLAFGTFYFMKVNDGNLQGLEWIPLVCLSVTIFVANMGFIPLAFVVIAEIFPQKIKGIFTSLFLAWSWILSFTTVKYYFLAVDNIGMHGCMLIFAVFCLFEFIFALIFLPETRGKSFEEIYGILVGKSI